MKKSQGNQLTFINSKFFLFVVLFEVLILFLLINNQFFPIYLAFLAAQFLFTTAVAAKKLQHMKSETEKCLSNYHKRINDDEEYIYELQKENRNLKQGIEESRQVSRNENKLTEEMNNIFADMAHELRTPLNSMIGFSTLILNDDYEIDKNELKEMIDIIRNSSRKLLSLIDNIIHISMEKYTLASPSPDYCDITQTLQAVSSVGKGLTKKREDVSFKSYIQDKNPEVYTDDRVLGKVLSSIFEHAASYLKKGEIVFNAFEKNNHLTIQLSIIDNTKALENIFIHFMPEKNEKIENDELASSGTKNLTKFEYARYSLLKMDALTSFDTKSRNQAVLAIKLKIKR